MIESLTVIPKNSVEEIHVILDTFQGKPLASIRIFYDAGGGDWRPTKKGVSFPVSKLDEVITAFQRAKEQIPLTE